MDANLEKQVIQIEKHQLILKDFWLKWYWKNIALNKNSILSTKKIIQKLKKNNK